MIQFQKARPFDDYILYSNYLLIQNFVNKIKIIPIHFARKNIDTQKIIAYLQKNYPNGIQSFRLYHIL